MGEDDTYDREQASPAPSTAGLRGVVGRLLSRWRRLPQPVPGTGGGRRGRGSRRQPPTSALGAPAGGCRCYVTHLPPLLGFGPERMVPGGLFNQGSCELAPFVRVLPFPARTVKNNLLSTYKLVESKDRLCQGNFHYSLQYITFPLHSSIDAFKLPNTIGIDG